MITEKGYKEMPKWQKEGMAPCACGGKAVLFYDEDRNYRVECCNCQRTTLFKAKSMTQAKETWRMHPHSGLEQ